LHGEPCFLDDMCVLEAECHDGNCEATRLSDCLPPGECQEDGVCNPLTGICEYATSPDGTACDDGNAETPGDVCVAGVCTCTAGPCCGIPDGTACKNGNKCLKDPRCQNEVCTGTTKICAPPTNCKEAVGGCNPATGFCTFVKKPDGTACNDHSSHTKNDQCVNGFCVGTPI
jgi:hypothetical protein